MDSTSSLFSLLAALRLYSMSLVHSTLLYNVHTRYNSMYGHISEPCAQDTWPPLSHHISFLTHVIRRRIEIEGKASWKGRANDVGVRSHKCSFSIPSSIVKSAHNCEHFLTTNFRKFLFCRWPTLSSIATNDSLISFLLRSLRTLAEQYCRRKNKNQK